MKFTKDGLKQIIAEEIESFLSEEPDDDFWGYDEGEAQKANQWIEQLEELSIKAFVSLATKLLEKNSKLIKTPEGAKSLATQVVSPATPAAQAILSSPEVSEIRKFIYFSDKPSLVRADMREFQDEKEYLGKTLRALLGNIRASIRLPAMIRLHQDLYPADASQGEDSDLEPAPLRGKPYNPDAPPSLEFPEQEVEGALEDFLQTDEYIPLTPTVLLSPEAMHKIAQRK